MVNEEIQLTYFIQGTFPLRNRLFPSQSIVGKTSHQTRVCSTSSYLDPPYCKNKQNSEHAGRLILKQWWYPPPPPPSPPPLPHTHTDNKERWAMYFFKTFFLIAEVPGGGGMLSYFSYMGIWCWIGYGFQRFLYQTGHTVCMFMSSDESSVRIGLHAHMDVKKSLNGQPKPSSLWSPAVKRTKPSLE